jgi:cell wall-associated NlpC family hydrolase
MVVSLKVSKLLAVMATIFTLGFALLFSPLTDKASAATVSSGQKVVDYANGLKGKPYKWGGTTPKGFDASGFTQYAFKNSVKMTLPRTTKDQYKMGAAVPQKSLQMGDLVFYKTSGKTVSFVGIYVGKGQFIGATSSGVKVNSMSLKYWKDRYVGAKRVLK